MPLVTTTEMFKKAYQGHYAIGAFNVNNMETIQGIIAAGKRTRSPLILQISQGARKYANIIYLKKLIEAAVIDAPELPLAMHLDHGDTFEICKACVDDGFTSVMIDASHLPFSDNIALSKKVVEYAHDHGVVVEAELGKLAGIEEHVVNDRSQFTDPDEVEEFVAKTNVDSLAIAIGTSHGAFKFKGNAQLRFDILEEVSKRLPNFPIVLHGASSVPQEFVDMIQKYGGNVQGAQGVPEEMLRQASKLAVCKINIDSDIRLACTAKIREHFAEYPAHFDPRQYLAPAREAIADMVERKIINVLGSQDKI
ncbi:MAG: class II fructose-1,6-bisphosphate aldolase [Clostridia bacterium]|nr:class II fructose-1,6-bisphosphate aldolase [Clostridia bacterium]